MKGRFILSADGEQEEETDRQRGADEAWEKTISQMRAQIERRPLTTSCLGVTAQPHLSVCVPGWTRPKGSVAPSAAVCLCCVSTHTRTQVSLPVFVCTAVCFKAGFITQADKVSKQLVSDMLADKLQHPPPASRAQIQVSRWLQQASRTENPLIHVQLKWERIKRPVHTCCTQRISLVRTAYRLHSGSPSVKLIIGDLFLTIYQSIY